MADFGRTPSHFPCPTGLALADAECPPVWVTHSTSGHHKCLQSLLRKIITTFLFFFFSANCPCNTRFLISVEESVAAQTCCLPWKLPYTSPAQHRRRELQGIKDHTENVLGSFYFARRDGRVHEPFSPWMSRRLPYGCWKLLNLLCPSSINRSTHTPRPATGSHSSYSHPSSPGSSDLESWALAGSPWPPSASLLFCQKEVLMLLG